MSEKDCRTCKHAGWDPDGNYCVAPKVLAKHSFGRAIKTTGGGFPLGVPEFCEKTSFPLYESNGKVAP